MSEINRKTGLLLLIILTMLILPGCALIRHKKEPKSEKLSLLPPEASWQVISLDSEQAMFPVGQTLETWTDLVYIKGRKIGENPFFREDEIEKLRRTESIQFRSICETGDNFRMMERPGRYFLATCTKLKNSQSGETRVYRIVPGVSTVYIVYRAERVNPLSDDKLGRWLSYLGGASVCHGKPDDEFFSCREGEIVESDKNLQLPEGDPEDEEKLDLKFVNAERFILISGGILEEEGKPVLIVNIENKFYQNLWMRLHFQPPGSENEKCIVESDVQAGRIKSFRCPQVRQIKESDYSILIEAFADEAMSEPLDTRVQHFWFAKTKEEEDKRFMEYNHMFRY